jgi:hypothetical protein
MAENNWLLQDGRTILVEFETPAAATNWGWFGNRSSGEGLEFATPATAWANHAWLRGGQYDLAAETGGAATITGTLAVTEAQDTFASSGDIAHTGSLAVTEAQDVLAASGDIAHTGTLSVTEAQDVLTAAGDVAHVGTLAVTESQDAFTVSGDVAHVGTLAVTEAQDTFEAIGDNVHVGPLVVTEDQDSFESVGDIAHAGSLAATETQDSFEAIGSTPVVEQPVEGRRWSVVAAPPIWPKRKKRLIKSEMSAVEAQDTCLIYGDVITPAQIVTEHKQIPIEVILLMMAA